MRTTVRLLTPSSRTEALLLSMHWRETGNTQEPCDRGEAYCGLLFFFFSFFFLKKTMTIHAYRLFVYAETLKPQGTGLQLKCCSNRNRNNCIKDGERHPAVFQRHFSFFFSLKSVKECNGIVGKYLQ